ncbi:MAG: DUF4132 domain-containing protein [Burkholderia sp.]
MMPSTAEQLIAQLSLSTEHPRFAGPPVDLSALAAEALGRVWPAFRRVEHLRPEFGDPRATCLRAIREQVETLGLVPRLDAEASLALLREIPAGEWQRASCDLGFLAWPLDDAARTELIRILAAPENVEPFHRVSVYGEAALERFAGRPMRAERRAHWAGVFADAPFRLRELAVLDTLGPAALLTLADSRDGHFAPKRLGLHDDDPAVVLGSEPAYVAFIHAVLTDAARHLAAIHDGSVPYAADRAFPGDDVQVIARAARVAAHRDEPWLPELIGPLLRRVSVAPTAARTVPSQSLAIALGHAVEAAPTPEGVRALRDALAVVRHAGVKKKLERNLKPAERGLGERPLVALRMTLDGQQDARSDRKPDRKRVAMLATCLETSYWRGTVLDRDDWQRYLIDTPDGFAFAAGVIWQADAPDGARVAFLLIRSDDGVHGLDAEGRRCEIAAAGPIRLWHPSTACADERLAWQRAVLARKLRQPFRQAFRETYAAGDDDRASSETSMFSGHVLSVRPLIGLARREGWVLHAYEDGLTREFGAIRARLAVAARLYPGSQGAGTSGRLGFERRQGPRWVPIAIGEIEPMVFSEIARAVDLLVSVTGFALDADPLGEADRRAAADRDLRLHRLADAPLGEIARHRRQVLAMLFATQIARGDIALDARHLRIGEHAVHCATGRVTRHGEAVEIEPAPKGARVHAVPWLPYDEVLLERIVAVVGRLLDDSAGG